MENKPNSKNPQKLQIDQQCALIIVDMQNDFLPGGALEVKNGDQIIKGINKIAEIFHSNRAQVVLTQDWHPKDHLSFASQHEGKNPGDLFQIEGIGPVLWPDHCVQNTIGAKISDEIKIELGNFIIRKGYNREIDSYSAFFENDKKRKTGLSGLLKDLGISKVFVCGLALDYCCFYTALDAKLEGFDVYFIENLTKGIDVPENNISKSIIKMKENDIHIISEQAIKLT